MSEWQVVGKEGVPLGLGDALLHGFVGQFFKQTEGVKTLLQDLALDLPQIVVVGQESSGKSSVLESLAMMPLFPRDESICTRMPIHLKMRHREASTGVSGSGSAPGSGSDSPTVEVETPQIKMRLVFSDGRAPVESDDGFQTEEVAQQMRTWMDEIVRGTNSDGSAVTGVVDHVLEIEVTSSLVPTLDLIDLPGIVAGRLVDEPEDMMHQTRALVEKYLKMPHTLVLAVVPAFERVRNSQAFQLVQQYGLEDRTIGVLTMVDRAIDVSNPKGPLAAVMDRLDEVSSDVVKLKHGYVAVKNRDTRLEDQPVLEAFKRDEMLWLESNLAGYVEKKLASSGILASKLEMLLADHVRTTWVSQTIGRLTEGIDATKAKIKKLSVDPQTVVDSLLVAENTTARCDLIRDLLGAKLALAIEVVDHEILPLVRVIAREMKRKQEQALVLPPMNGLTHRSTLWAISSRESETSYFQEHLRDIMASAALRLIRAVRRHLTTNLSTEEGASELDLFQIHRFEELYSLPILVIWETLQFLYEKKGTLVAQLIQSPSYPSEPLSSTQLHTESSQQSLHQTLKDVNEFLETGLGEKPIEVKRFMDDAPDSTKKASTTRPNATTSSHKSDGASTYDMQRRVTRIRTESPIVSTSSPFRAPQFGVHLGLGRARSSSHTPHELSQLALPKSMQEEFVLSPWLEPVLLWLTEHALGCELRCQLCPVLGCARVRRALQRELSCVQPCTCSMCTQIEVTCAQVVRAAARQAIATVIEATERELIPLFVHSLTCSGDRFDMCKYDRCHEAREIMSRPCEPSIGAHCTHHDLARDLGASILQESVIAASYTWGIPAQTLVDILATPRSERTSRKAVHAIVDLSDTERRVFTALGRHVVTPMLQALTDVANLDFHLLAYIQNYPDVTAKAKHWFSESGQAERVRLTDKLARLQSVQEGLEALVVMSEL